MDERAIAEAEPTELPRLIGELARLHALALSRLLALSARVDKNPETEEPLITADEAAKLAGVSPVAMRRSARFRAARRKLGARTLRFDRAAILRAIRRAA
jgi:hypothetical protein